MWRAEDHVLRGAFCSAGDIRAHVDQLRQSLEASRLLVLCCDERVVIRSLTFLAGGAPAERRAFEERFRQIDFGAVATEANALALELSRDRASGSTSVERVCLIDHRSSGPGPRCLDAAALEWSIRIADAEAIERQFGVEGQLELTRPAMVKAMRVACGRASAELRLHENLWGEGRPPAVDQWIDLSSHVVLCVQSAFTTVKPGPVTAEEYTQTMVHYAVHQAGRKQRPVVRARLCAWLSAQYSVLPRD